MPHSPSYLTTRFHDNHQQQQSFRPTIDRSYSSSSSTNTNNKIIEQQLEANWQAPTTFEPYDAHAKIIVIIHPCRLHWCLQHSLERTRAKPFFVVHDSSRRGCAGLRSTPSSILLVDSNSNELVATNQPTNQPNNQQPNS